jgi:hypothetical protein
MRNPLSSVLFDQLTDMGTQISPHEQQRTADGCKPWRRLHETSGVGFAHERTISQPVYTLAHLSDSHVTSVRIPGLHAMLNKRIFGNWSFKRQDPSFRS